MTQSYTAPTLDGQAFHCPNCQAFAHQQWGALILRLSSSTQLPQWKAAVCMHCGEISVWRDKAMIYPATTSAPAANADLPDDIKRDYNEAAVIVQRSPRGAAALLRLAIQKICRHLGEPGQNINTDIAALV